jgi:hypothetical protein
MRPDFALYVIFGGIMDLVDVAKQIYDIKDAVQKIYSDLGDNISEINKMLNVFVELPGLDVDLVGNLIIEKNIGEERYIPFWLKLLLYPFTNIGDDKVIVDSLALRVNEERGVSFHLKVCYIVSSTSDYLHTPGRAYECSLLSFTLLKSKKNVTPLKTLVAFAYLTTNEDWRYIVDELDKLVARKSELEKAVTQLKTSIASLKLIS